MKFKLFDSELKVIEILWEKGEATAKEIAAELTKKIGWNKITTYGVINKCIEKGYISRGEKFLCQPLITKSEVQESETMELGDKLYDGSKSSLIASLLKTEKLDAQQFEELRKIVKNSSVSRGNRR